MDVVQQVSKDEPSGVGDTVTKKMVFYLPERYVDPQTKIEWDGRYLLVQPPSIETMILDFDPVCPLQDSKYTYSVIVVICVTVCGEFIVRALDVDGCNNMYV